MFRNLSVFLVCAFAVQCLADPDCSQRPKKEDLMNCCAKPPAYEDIVRKCSDKFPFQQGQPNFCVDECIFNETGVTVNGVVQKDKLSEKIGELYKDIPDFLPGVAKAIEKCDEFVRAKLVEIMEHKSAGADKCNPVASMYESCFFVDEMISCPASDWQNTDNCNRAKEFMKSCPMPYNH
ncbi:unnamed protein product [Hermetia illucens]|uniref:OBP47-like domain-containing protein n=1 Tax=Hermetia illucens TaxID=343691 RepID=A0A7R8UFZ3_HERIL|nr:uncharacterized protein LOC119646346 [Hermetia illucens]CAD7079857.1 unnamed protein product [Hermetia illucens]